MNIVSLPAIVALVLKALLFFYALQARSRSANTNLFLVLVAVLGLHNLLELIGLNYYAARGLDPLMIFIANGYVATLMVFTTVLLHLCIRFNAVKVGQSRVPALLLYAPAAALIFLIFFTDLVISGFRPFKFNVIRIAGPWYFLFETFLTVYLGAGLYSATRSAAATPKGSATRARQLLWLLGLAPMSLLLIYLILSRHLPVQQFTSQVFTPLAQSFFLVVAAYAIHQHRLFDIEFFIPWSRVRRRKTEFYRRIQATIAELADFDCAKAALERVSAILRCPVALVGAGRPVLAHAGAGATDIAQFPAEPLERLNRIVVAGEIERDQPELHRVMTQFGVAAIVPYYPGAKSAASYLLLGNDFNGTVYTPLDFKQVERLFDALGDFFLDRISFLHAELSQARNAEQALQEHLEERDRELARLREENGLLRDVNFRLLRDNRDARRSDDDRCSSDQDAFTLEPALPPDALGKPLSDHVKELEANLIREALRQCEGNKSGAARLLGLKPNTLHYKLERLGMADDK